jgi:hypothetical protein
VDRVENQTLLTPPSGLSIRAKPAGAVSRENAGAACSPGGEDPGGKHYCIFVGATPAPIATPPNRAAPPAGPGARFRAPQRYPGWLFPQDGNGNSKDAAFVRTPAPAPQETAMIEEFVELATSGDAQERAPWAASSLKTQEYLDAIRAAAT